MKRLPMAVITDAVLIVVFAAVGRRTHDEGSAIGQTLVIAAPFLIGYALAAAALRLDRDPLSTRRAIPVWLAGIAVGLALRGTVFDRGLAPAFVVVAFLTTGLLLLGWRSVVARRRALG